MLPCGCERVFECEFDADRSACYQVCRAIFRSGYSTNDDFCVAQCVAPASALLARGTSPTPRAVSTSRRARKRGGGVWSGARGRSGRRAWRLASLRDWRREPASRRPASRPTRARPGVTPPSAHGEPNLASCSITSRSRVEQRRAATTSEFLSSREASSSNFSTSSAPRLDAMVSSSASETVRLSERYTLLARSASDDTLLSLLNWRDGVLRATGRGLLLQCPW